MDRRFLLKTLPAVLILLIIYAVFLARDKHKEPSAAAPQITTQAAKSVQAQLTLPTVDNLAALNRAKEKEENGVYRFAEAIPVEITPFTHGTWENLPTGGSRWTLEVDSPGASSLNFGFSHYEMPEGGSLTIQTPGDDPAFRSFTSADNESHGELWTPILRGDSALISVDLANGDRNSVVLELASVNHGFRSEKIGGESSGSCNIDVNCDSSSLPGIGEMIEMFSDQIRSVGAYTLNGVDTCTGALINNTANDRRPFFLTADHCGVNAGNASSMVVFWNFENSFCRAPNTPASGGIGNGNLSQFNSGAIFRAGNSTTDFTLVELDDQIDSDVDAYYAGWDRSGANPQSVIGIHHPAVAEKRISFSFTQSQTTSQGGTTPPGDGNYVRVVSWDEGTTEGGSSGSPLFDPEGRIIGQLFGGFAACGNDESDWYGRFSRSWSGGFTDTTRLSNWLDPTNSGATVLDGIGTGQLFTVTGNSGSENDVGTLEFTVSLSEPIAGSTSQPITIDYTTADGSADAVSDYIASSGTLTFAPGQLTASVPITVLSDADPEENETFELLLSNVVPNTAAVISTASATGTILNDDFVLPVFPTAPSASASAGVPLSFFLTAQNTPTEFGLSGAIPFGMQIDSMTGEITWTPSESGQVDVDVFAENTAGRATSTLTIAVAENPLLTAIDNTGFSIESGIGSPWGAQSSVTFDGIDAIQSAPLGNNGSSEFVLETEGAGLLEFYWRVSSEEGFDFLSFSSDGQTVAEISGETGWEQFTIRVPVGVHRFVWRYQKDFSEIGGNDAGYLDSVRFLGDNDPIVLQIADARIPSGSPYAQRVDFSPSAATLTTGELPTWLSLNDQGFLTGTPPRGSSGTSTITLTATLAGSSATTSFDITALPTVDFADNVGSGSTVAFLEESDLSWRSLTGGADSGSTFIGSSVFTRDNGSSSIRAIVRGPATLTFAWRVSSEEGFDFLDFFFDGFLIGGISGNVAWEDVTIAIPDGTHDLEWSYSKDGSRREGLDRGDVDTVTLSGYGAWITTQAVDGFVDPTYDPDGDQRVNFMEYALDTDPAIADTAERLTYNFESIPPTVNVAKPSTVEGVRYLLQTSTNLSSESWTEENSEITTDSDSSFIAAPTSTPSGIFLRLGAESVDP